MFVNNKVNNAKKVRNELMRIAHFIRNNEFNISEDDKNTMANFCEYGIVVLNKSNDLKNINGTAQNNSRPILKVINGGC